MSENPTGNSWLPLGRGVRVLGSHPCGLIALEKPPGVLSHPNPEGPPQERERSLLTAEYDFDRECYAGLDNPAAPKVVHLLHRLDSATSGVILVATDDAVADTVRYRFSSNDVEKTYLAVCRGRGGPGMHGLWVDAMEKYQPNEGNFVRAAKGMFAEARTKYWWVRNDEHQLNMCLMRLSPQTGRTHQLRFQGSRHGYPIVGDRIYGSYRFNHKVTKITGNKRLYLHAAHIKLKFMHGGEMVRFGAESPLPPEFDELMGKNETWRHEFNRKPTAREIIEMRRAKVRESLKGPHSRATAQNRARRPR